MIANPFYVPLLQSVTGGTAVGGDSITGTVTLAAAVPSKETAPIILASSNPKIATVPASVTVPAGAQSVAFPITTTAVTAASRATIIAKQGGITQTATINLAVSAATARDGVGTPVDLSAAYNVSGIYTDGTTYSTGGLDGGGFSYSANLLTPARRLTAIQFF